VLTFVEKEVGFPSIEKTDHQRQALFLFKGREKGTVLAKKKTLDPKMKGCRRIYARRGEEITGSLHYLG